MKICVKSNHFFSLPFSFNIIQYFVCNILEWWCTPLFIYYLWTQAQWRETHMPLQSAYGGQGQLVIGLCFLYVGLGNSIQTRAVRL